MQVIPYDYVPLSRLCRDPRRPHKGKMPGFRTADVILLSPYDLLFFFITVLLLKSLPSDFILLEEEGPRKALIPNYTMALNSYPSFLLPLSFLTFSPLVQGRRITEALIFAPDSSDNRITLDLSLPSLFRSGRSNAEIFLLCDRSGRTIRISWTPLYPLRPEDFSQLYLFASVGGYPPYPSFFLEVLAG